MGLLLAGACGATLVAVTPGARADEARTPGAVAAPQSGAGMRIYLDPDTGEVGPPPRGVLLGAPSPSLSTSSVGLVETAGTSAAGGVTVHLQGRFRRAMQATADGSGTTVHTDCVPGAVGAQE